MAGRLQLTAPGVEWTVIGSAFRSLSPGLRVLGLLRSLLDQLDRRLHSTRRRSLLERLRQQPAPRSVLFVCHGNIYRSPYAAAAFNAALAPTLRDRIRVESAGFLGPGYPSPPPAVEAAARVGIDLNAHRSSFLTAERVRRADWIVVMDAGLEREIVSRFGRGRGLIVLGDLDPWPIQTRTIADPLNQPEEAIKTSYERIRRCVRELVREIPLG
jgi:protein-tyrosine-phosphatase